MNVIEKELVVLGAGPGGYAAAFYASDLGMDVMLIDQEPRLGGVCLNRGCIPSKAYLHVAKMINEAKEASKWGVYYGKPKIKLDELRKEKNQIINKLSDGIKSLSLKRGVQVVEGRGYFEDSETLRVETGEGQKFVKFKYAIIAVGSKPTIPPAFDLGNKRIMTSTEALEVESIPNKLLVVGGGYIGLELGTVYATLGSKVTLVEALGGVLTGVDTDLVRPVIKNVKGLFEDIRLNTKVVKMATKGKQISVALEENGNTKKESFDKVLVSIGRKPNCEDLGLKNADISVDERGFITVDHDLKTSKKHIYAIGDVNGGIMLAHKASKDAKVAVQAIAGKNMGYHSSVIPCVVFTDPEVAWCGLTESDAKAKNINVSIAKLPWLASGRAASFGRTDGLTKLVIEPDTERILGVGIAGYGAGELISEGVLAVEMGSTARDLAETVHPHPTLSETLMECAESFYGTAAHALSK